MNPFLIDAIAWAGSITGAAGAIVLAPRARYSGWGWVLFLASNVFWICASLARHDVPQLFMQAVLTITSLVGMWKYLIAPLCARRQRDFGIRLALHQSQD